MRPIGVKATLVRNQRRYGAVQGSDPTVDNVAGVPSGTASSARLSLLT
jgi:hypothetical protein